MSLRPHLLYGSVALGFLATAAMAQAPAGRAAAAGGQEPAAPAPAELAPQPGDTRLADAVARQDSDAVARLLTGKKKPDVNAPGRDGATPLQQAVRFENYGIASALVEVGADVNKTSGLGLSPLTMAAQDGAVEMMTLLLDQGADPNVMDPAGETALMAASREGTAKAVALLLDKGARIDARDKTFGQTALMIAVRENHPEVVDLLIKRGADVNARSRVGPMPKPRMPGEGGGSHGEGIVRSGIPPQGARPAQPGGMTPLLYAARDGRTDSAKLLLDAKANIELADANAMTPLLMALLNDQLPTAQLLLDRGAAVNVHDYWGRTPIFAAIDVRNREVNAPNKKENGVDRPAALQMAKVLLDKGADPNVQVKEYAPDRRYIMTLGSLAWVNFTGQTAFIRAALSDDVDGMKLLLQYKADPNITPASNTTALAAASGVNWVFNQTWTDPGRQLEAVKFLVDLGQDVNAVNDMGLGPLHGAANRGSNDVIEYLVSKGANLEAKDKVGRTPLVWAGGVFLATNAPEPRPATQALIKDLLAKQPPAKGDRAKVANAPDGRKDAARSRF